MHVVGLLFLLILLVFLLMLLGLLILDFIARIKMLKKIGYSGWYVFLPFLVDVLYLSEADIDQKTRNSMYNYTLGMLIAGVAIFGLTWIPYIGYILSNLYSISTLVYYIIYTIVINKSFIKQNGEKSDLALPLLSSIFIRSPFVYYYLSKKILVPNPDLEFKLKKYKVLGFVTVGIPLAIIVIGIIFLGTAMIVDSLYYY